MSTKLSAAINPHFQAAEPRLPVRNNFFLVSRLFSEPHPPPNHFRYAHRAIIIGITHQGAGTIKRKKDQTAIPTELTNNPVMMARIKMGIRSQPETMGFECSIEVMVNF